MMKSIISEMDQVRVVGFDLDGTLYDEFCFIYQAYYSVAEIISHYCRREKSEIHRLLCIQWLKYGSSEANLFQNTFHACGRNEVSENMINECIRSYRSANFMLKLPERSLFLLNYLKKNGYGLFLITDGSKELQWAKIKKLELEQWFDVENIAVSGDYGSKYQKPCIYMKSKIKLLRDQEGVLYLGDREVDKRFAQNAGFRFLKVKNMNI